MLKLRHHHPSEEGAPPRHRRGKPVAAACAALALSCLLATPTGAITATYDSMSTAYRGSRYELNLRVLEPTGDGATDIVMVAMSQLGYTEGDRYGQTTGERQGHGNFTEYNYFNGKVDQEGNGVLTLGYPWCASFVTWCARMAGISEEVLPGSLNCARWVELFRARGEYRTRASGYVPKQGDLVFFRSRNATAISTHVGVVRYECNGMVYTVEGNSGDAVQMKCYSLTDNYIVGYATPDYASKPATAQDYLLDEYTEGNYIIAARQLAVRARPGGGKVTFTLRRGDLMHIYECQGGWGRTDYGWIPMGDTQPIDVRG